jgi:hypothetical protein
MIYCLSADTIERFVTSSLGLENQEYSSWLCVGLNMFELSSNKHQRGDYDIV